VVAGGPVAGGVVSGSLSFLTVAGGVVSGNLSLLTAGRHLSVFILIEGTRKARACDLLCIAICTRPLRVTH